LLGELLLGRGEQVPVLLVAPDRPHPGPAQAITELVRPVALAGVDGAAHADRGIAEVGLDGTSLEGLALGDRGALGADLGSGLGDRAGVGEVVRREARLEQGPERAKLARLVRPPFRCAASIGQTPPSRST
jgi:hypothetical protein